MSARANANVWKQKKAERDIEIVTRYANGETPGEIAEALTADGGKVSENPVRRVLKKQQFCPSLAKMQQNGVYFN